MTIHDNYCHFSHATRLHELGLIKEPRRGEGVFYRYGSLAGAFGIISKTTESELTVMVKLSGANQENISAPPSHFLGAFSVMELAKMCEWLGEFPGAGNSFDRIMEQYAAIPENQTKYICDVLVDVLAEAVIGALYNGQITAAHLKAVLDHPLRNMNLDEPTGLDQPAPPQTGSGHGLWLPQSGQHGV